MNIENLPIEITCEITKNLEDNDLKSFSLVNKKFYEIISYSNSLNVQNFHIRNIQSIRIDEDISESLMLQILKKPSLRSYQGDLSLLCQSAIHRNFLLVSRYILKNFKTNNFKHLYEEALIGAASKGDSQDFKKFYECKGIHFNEYVLTRSFLKALCRKDDSNEIIKILLDSDKINPTMYEFEIALDQIFINNQFEKLKILIENKKFHPIIKNLLPKILDEKIRNMKQSFVKKTLENFKFTEREKYSFFYFCLDKNRPDIISLFKKEINSSYDYHSIALKKSIEYGNYNIYAILPKDEDAHSKNLSLIFKNAIKQGMVSSLKNLIIYEKENLTIEDLKIALKMAIKYKNIPILHLLLEKVNYSSEDLNLASQLAYSSNEIFTILNSHYAIKKQYEEKIYFKMVFEALKWLFLK